MAYLVSLLIASFAFVSSSLAGSDQNVASITQPPCMQNSQVVQKDGNLNNKRNSQNDFELENLLNAAISDDNSKRKIADNVDNDNAKNPQLKNSEVKRGDGFDESSFNKLDTNTENTESKDLQSNKRQNSQDAPAENEENENENANQMANDQEELAEDAADEMKDAFFRFISSRRRRRRRSYFFNIFTRRRRRSSTTTSSNYQPNGCSTPMGVSAPFKNTFTPSCNTHDICYYYKQQSRLGCDNAFLINMQNACRRRASSNFFGGISLSFCLSSASAYYAAVRAGGSSHYGPNGR